MTRLWLSPAKINLHLKILRKRPDGYHDLATLMQRVSLYDELWIEPHSRDIVIECPDAPLPVDEGNLVYRAADLILRTAGWPTGVHITLKKNIPIAAGLGGGSSNAATALMGINEMMGFPFSRENLLVMAARIGADVPFFILEKTAWAFGIGDRLEALDEFPKLSIILINPGFELSTAEVYRRLNFTLTNEPIRYSIPRLLTVHDIMAGLHNDLEGVSIPMHPIIGELKDHLLSRGALGALMSGSGPT
ncbi:MAG: 4-(cytidine 5'-diphospho)-2-C-methyl-D-erythritol kinase, partial [Syntrophales bacterium]|nr:4-(cytidine 5'-diphospho)-2-C-methyl-D-erythritol kinase [Syntrophales bacterium]